MQARVGLKCSSCLITFISGMDSRHCFIGSPWPRTYTSQSELIDCPVRMYSQPCLGWLVIISGFIHSWFFHIFFIKSNHRALPPGAQDCSCLYNSPIYMYLLLQEMTQRLCLREQQEQGCSTRESEPRLSTARSMPVLTRVASHKVWTG